MTFGSIGGIHQVELSPDGLSLAKNAEYKHIAVQDIDNDKSRLTVFEGAMSMKGTAGGICLQVPEDMKTIPTQLS